MPNRRFIGDDVAYRRGALLGFTLAEIVLLIIFALLLTAGTMILARDASLKKLEVRIVELQKGQFVVTQKEASIVEVLNQFYNQKKKELPKPDEFARNLALVENMPNANALMDTIKELASILDMKPSEQEFMKDLVIQVKKLRDERTKLQNEIAQLKSELGNAQAAVKQKDLPPIITIAADNYFLLGKATLMPEFRARLVDEIIPSLVQQGREYNVQVIEIVGHTDELPIAAGQSNLDKILINFMNGAGQEGDLVPADNSGLGMARAAAVAKVLNTDGRLRGFRIFPYSAAQLIDKDIQISRGLAPGDSRERRRIEIRMRRLN